MKNVCFESWVLDKVGIIPVYLSSQCILWLCCPALSIKYRDLLDGNSILYLVEESYYPTGGPSFLLKEDRLPSIVLLRRWLERHLLLSVSTRVAFEMSSYFAPKSCVIYAKFIWEIYLGIRGLCVGWPKKIAYRITPFGGNLSRATRG